MGAENIEFRLKGKATKAQISAAFMARREQDAFENGHQDGYSGDFQTVHCVDYKYLGDVFDSYETAVNLALDKAEKYEVCDCREALQVLEVTNGKQ